MSRRAVYTTAGIILSFAIAIGGWVITSRLIDIESDRLLSATSSFSVDMPVAAQLGMDEEYNPDTRLRLTENEIVSVLQNWDSLLHWDSAARLRLHEPAPGQIDMQQAIITAREGVGFLLDYNILPLKLLSFNDTRAYLGQYILERDNFLPIEYSFWNVRFFNDYMEILMRINATTGQIWRIDIDITPAFAPESLAYIYVSKYEAKNALVAFMTELDIPIYDDFIYEGFTLIHDTGRPFDTPVILPPLYLNFDGFGFVETSLSSRVFTLVSHRFADGHAAARITATGVLTSDDILHFGRLSISLTTATSSPYQYSRDMWMDTPQYISPTSPRSQY